MSLFGGWPAENIAQIYDDPNFKGSDRARFYRYSSNDISSVRLAKRAFNFLRKLFRRPSGIDPLVSPTSPRAYLKSNRILSACGDIAPLTLPNDLLSWVEEFNPDVIYSVLGSVRMMNIVLGLEERYRTPVVVHFMDDWPATLYSQSSLLFPARFILDRKLRSVIEKSSGLMAISRDMGDEYSYRYGRSFNVFMNCTQVASEIPASREDAGDLIRFGYVGGLHLNRSVSLVEISRALQLIKDGGSRVSLSIFSPQRDIDRFRDSFAEYSVISEIGSLAAEDVAKMLCELDVLVHVESFEDGDARYTRLSVSTKIPQYMASARPILAYGPGQLSSIRYVEQCNAGIAVTSERDLSALQCAADALTDAGLRRRLGSNGYWAARDHHDSTLVQAHFQSIICGAVAKVACMRGAAT